MMQRAAIVLGVSLCASTAFAQGDAAQGEELFVICAGCHQIGPDAISGLGPHLNNLIGREVGSVEGYHYSPALRELEDPWTPETLDAFLQDPTAFAYGTYMIVEGVTDAAIRGHLIAYIEAAGTGAAAGGISAEVAAILDFPADEAYGAYLSAECTACHAAGTAGIPSISGLPQASFAAGLVAYRDGSREHQVMNMLAARLGDEEIAALAAYFATLE